MIDEIMDAIAIKINKIFGNEYCIYKHDVEQGLKKPCFLITVIDYSKESFLNLRSKRLLPIDILFFPSLGKSQCYAVAEQLTDELDIIETISNEKFLGTQMRSEVVDNVLHFFVSYNFIVVTQKEKIDSMETVEVNTTTKE